MSEDARPWWRGGGVDRDKKELRETLTRLVDERAHMRELWADDKRKMHTLEREVVLLREAVQTLSEMKLQGDGLAVYSAKRLLNHILASTFDLWLERTIESRRLGVLLNRFAIRMNMRVVGRAFYVWSARVDERDYVRPREQRGEAVASRCAGRRRRRLLVSAFELWVQRVEEAREPRATEQARLRAEQAQAAAAARRERHVQEVAARCVRRLQLRSAAEAFATWTELVEEAGRLRAVGERVTRRLLNSHLVRAFGRWEEWASESRRLRALADKVFARWREFALINRHQVSVLAIRASRQRTEAHLRLHAVWGPWRARTRQVCSRLRLKVLRMDNLRRAAAFRAWQALVWTVCTGRVRLLRSAFYGWLGGMAIQRCRQREALRQTQADLSETRALLQQRTDVVAALRQEAREAKERAALLERTHQGRASASKGMHTRVREQAEELSELRRANDQLESKVVTLSEQVVVMKRQRHECNCPYLVSPARRGLRSVAASPITTPQSSRPPSVRGGAESARTLTRLVCEPAEDSPGQKTAPEPEILQAPQASPPVRAEPEQQHQQPPAKQRLVFDAAGIVPPPSPSWRSGVN